MRSSAIFRNFLLLVCAALFSCQSATPEKCFDVAVLNSNMVVGFANDGLWRQLESPSMKMGKTKDEIVPMPRADVISDKIKFSEETLDKVKSLSQNEDNKDIIQASLAMHQYILPVYKREYTQLAKSFDGGAPKEKTIEQAQAIHDKYFTNFETLYNTLISSGKLYAAKHHIDVKWAD
jgi:hypothetical protein